MALPTDMALVWGRNTSGQLGDGTTTNRHTPVDLLLSAGAQVTAVSAGADHSLALASDGRVLAWGGNSDGQLGDGTTSGGSTPVEVDLPAGIRGRAVSAGGLHSLALASDGRVLAWGGNSDGQLGDGTTSGGTAPVEVDLPAGIRGMAVSAGGLHSLALTSDGRVLAWGDNSSGQLGDGTRAGRSTPVAVLLPAGARVTAVSAGIDHSLALTSDGRVLAWGNSGFGQLGDGTTASSSTPVAVDLPADTRVTAVSAGGLHSLALTSDGRVLAWGDNASGQLGDSMTTEHLAPVAVHLPAGIQVTAVSAGGFHALALTSDGRVLAWGDNASGQLGDGTSTNRTTPVPVVRLLTDTRVTAIAAGLFHSVAQAVALSST